MCVCLGFRCLQSKDDEALQVGVDQDLLTGEKKENVGTKHRAGESAKLKARLNAQQTERVQYPAYSDMNTGSKDHHTGEKEDGN